MWSLGRCMDIVPAEGYALHPAIQTIGIELAKYRPHRPRHPPQRQKTCKRLIPTRAISDRYPQRRTMRAVYSGVLYVGSEASQFVFLGQEFTGRGLVILQSHLKALPSRRAAPEGPIPYPSVLPLQSQRLRHWGEATLASPVSRRVVAMHPRCE